MVFIIFDVVAFSFTVEFMVVFFFKIVVVVVDHKRWFYNI